VAETRDIRDSVGAVFDAGFPDRAGSRDSVETFLKRLGFVAAEAGELALSMVGITERHGPGFSSFHIESIRLAVIANSATRVELTRQFQADQQSDAEIPKVAVQQRVVEFEHESEQSFLPLILELGTDNGIPLVFVRVKYRPESDGSQYQSTVTSDYFLNLREFIERSGHKYVDMTAVESLSREKYSDDVHINTDFRAEYTRMFVSQLPDVFSGRGVGD